MKTRPRSLVRLIRVQALVLTLILSACAAPATPADRSAGRLNIVGSTTCLPVVAAAAEAFMQAHSGARITVSGGGSSLGVTSVIDSAADIGMVSRPLRPAELERNPGLTRTLIGHDGVAVVVSRAVYEGGVRRLTLDQIAALWRGEITNWQQVGGPDRPVAIFDKELGRGTRDTFAEIVLGDKDAPAPGAIGVVGENNEVVTTVAQADNAVSILSNGFQTPDVIGVAIVLPDGLVVEPTPENIRAGTYPIARELALITDGPPTGLAEAFLDFLVSPAGQAFVTAQGYVALPEDAAAQAR